MGISRHSATNQASPWIYNPWLDLIVGCGAWSAPLLLVSYFSVAAHARTWSVAFYVLALFFNYPHYMATIYRAYHRAEDFEKYRVFTVHITGLMLLTLLASHFWMRILPWIFTIYLTWSPWHYSGQNYGLFMMFARRAGAQPTNSERRALYGAFIASYLILFLGFHTGASSDPLFVSIGIPAVISKWEQAILGVAFIGLSIFGLRGLARTAGWRKLMPSLTLFSSQFLWFLFPAAISLIKGLEIPQSRYSSGVLAVMHSAQYLWITSYYAKREASAETLSKTNRDWRPLAYFAILVLGGIALFVPGPWLASRAFHHDFTASFLIFTALVNIHHFILDGAIWKLRDGKIAALLLNTRERLSGSAAEAGGQLRASWQWITGRTTAARSLRVSLAVLLLLWGTIDQLRYYLALHTDDLKDMQRAAALDSVDSSLQMHLARRAMEVDDPQDAEAAWKRAMQANPADPGPRQALLQFLIDRDRYDEAYALTESSLKYFPRDANLLVNRGLLALQKGNSAEALASWNQALTVDPRQSSAHLYLASELDREGKAQEAASHYGTYLESVARSKPEQRPEPDRIIVIALRMADCQARSSQVEMAIRSYHLAEKLAAQTKTPKLESLADVNEAELQAKTGKFDNALQLFQHALHLDQTAADDNAAAQDWYAYGQFLDNAGFPPRIVYACVLKSESLIQAHTSNVPEPMEASRKKLEARLGPAAGEVRRNPEAAAQEALALRR